MRARLTKRPLTPRYASLRECLAPLRDRACCAPSACRLRARGEWRARWCRRKKGGGICCGHALV